MPTPGHREKILLRQFASGWFLPYSIESRSAHQSIPALLEKTLPVEISKDDLKRPTSVLKLNLSKNLVLQEVIAQIELKEDFDRKVFERNVSFPQKWVSLTGKFENNIPFKQL